MRQSLELKDVRNTLSQMEDAIIFSLFRRSQYLSNDSIYVPSESMHIEGFKGSFLDYLLNGTETLHATAGRYLDPREQPFFQVHPHLKVERITEDMELVPVKINRNDEIKTMYIEAVKNICKPGDDNEYGYCAVLDISALQEISTRVHLGKFVAASKWKFNREALEPHIIAGDWSAVEEALRNRQVETEVFDRVREKGQRYGLDPEFIGQFYVQRIIPLTIEVEVEYLRQSVRRDES